DVHSKADLAKSHTSIGRILQQTGEPVEALRSFQHAIDLYESLPILDPHDNYNLASNLALCIPLIGTKNGSQASLDSVNLNKVDQRRRQVYSDRAVEVLRGALKGGIRNSDALLLDTDFDSIRDRPEFQTFIKDAAENSAKRR